MSGQSCYMHKDICVGNLFVLSQLVPEMCHKASCIQQCHYNRGALKSERVANWALMAPNSVSPVSGLMTMMTGPNWGLLPHSEYRAQRGHFKLDIHKKDIIVK